MTARPRQDPAARLPLKELELLILLCVSARPQHGYALLSAVAEASRQVIAPGPASLYRVIGELLSDGLLEEAAAPAGAAADPRRRYYAPTSFGQAVLRAELSRWSRLLRDAQARGIVCDTTG